MPEADAVALTETDLKRLASLARLRLESSELVVLKDQLGGVLDLVDQLQAVDTRGVEPLAHALDLELPLREDVVTEVNLREQYQSMSPQVESGLYLVPKVIE